MYQENPAA